MKAFYLATLLCTFFKLPLDGRIRYILTAEKNASKSEIRFVKKCLCQENIGELFHLRNSVISDGVFKEEFGNKLVIKTVIIIEHQIKSSNDCTGIYYYKLDTNSGMTAKFSGSEFLRVFCIANNKLITFSRDTTENRKIYRLLEPQLIQAIGREKTQKEQRYLIQGGAGFR